MREGSGPFCGAPRAKPIGVRGVSRQPSAMWRTLFLGRCRVSMIARDRASRLAFTVAILAQGTSGLLRTPQAFFSLRALGGRRAQLGRAVGKRIPFGDHPLKLERYRED